MATTEGGGLLDADRELRELVVARLNEAAERVTFHEAETERWRRIGRACATAAITLDSQVPTRTTTAEDFIGEGKPMNAVDHPMQATRGVSYTD